MPDVIFTTSEAESVESLDRALVHCYGDFDERMAAVAAEQGVPWPEDVPEHDHSPAALADFWRQHAIDLAHCIVAREGTGGPIVGIALLGRRGDDGWLADFAVSPERRGQGLGHRLMAAYLEQARSLGIRRVEFDVLTVNAPALRVYEAAGFRRDQRIDRFNARAQNLGLDESKAGDLQVAPLPRERIPVWFLDTMADQPPPCWERDLPSILNGIDTKALVASQGGDEKAVLVYTIERFATGPLSAHLHIAFAGFREDAGADHLRALLAEAVGDTGQEVDIIAGLEPIDSRLAAVLRELGFRQVQPSYNMRQEL